MHGPINTSFIQVFEKKILSRNGILSSTPNAKDKLLEKFNETLRYTNHNNFFPYLRKKKTNVFVVRCKPDFFFGEVSTLSEISFVRCIQLIKTFTKETFKLGSIKMKTAIQTDYSHLYRIAQNGSRSRKLRP